MVGDYKREDRCTAADVVGCYGRRCYPEVIVPLVGLVRIGAETEEGQRENNCKIFHIKISIGTPCEMSATGERF